MARKKDPLTAQAELFIRMSARGAERPELFREVFGVDYDSLTRQEKTKYDVKMNRWRKHPDFEKVWQDEVRKVLRVSGGRALKVLTSQLNSEKLPWLQNKAACDLLTQASKFALFGEDNNTVKVTISGLPDLGTPDEEGEAPAEDG